MAEPLGTATQLTLSLTWAEGRIATPRIGAPRVLAARLLQGRPADDAATLAPRLFTLCATAQGCAARRALAAAAGNPLPPPDTAEQATLMAEMVGEHLWRLALDWPARLATPPRQAALVAWRKHGRHQDWPGWADFSTAALKLPPCATSALPLLESLDARAWWQALAGDQDGARGLAHCWNHLTALAAAPTLAGSPREAGAAARWQDHSEVAALWQAKRRPAARLRARCLELEALGGGDWNPDWVDAHSPAPGIGIARVETARGPLLHLVQIKDGKVLRYVIVAPTEWNFHPAGAFVNDAAGLPAPTPQAALDLARTLALSLDPCVAVALTLD